MDKNSLFLENLFCVELLRKFMKFSKHIKNLFNFFVRVKASK